MNKEGRPVIVLVILGTLAMLVSCCFLFYMWSQGQRAQQASQNLLEEQSELADDEESALSWVLEIPAIDLELPVIWEYSDEALEDYICRFTGPDPGESGNLVITGHDYLGGALFGHLDEVEVGDTVRLVNSDGEQYSYTVYETELITPDDVGALGNYEGDHAVTLMTCADNANLRLLLRCAQADA